MRHLLRPLVVFLAVVLVSFCVGCGGGGGGGDWGGGGINQIAVRNAIGGGNIRGDIRAAAAAVPATAKVSLYQNGVLVSGPQDMGAAGVVFTGLVDGTYSVRITVGARIFQSSKTVSSTRTALIARVSYFNTSGLGILFEEILDQNSDGLAGSGENPVTREFSSGATSEATLYDAVDVTNWGAGLTGDSDGDGLINAFDEDIDGDGTLNSDESAADDDLDDDNANNDTDTDDDQDGIPDDQDQQPGGTGTDVQLIDGPAGFKTAGFPAVSPTMTIPTFQSPRKSAVVLVNTTSGQLTVTVAANGTGIVANQMVSANRSAQDEAMSDYERNLARLREIGNSLPAFRKTPVRLDIRANRAAVVNDQRTFYNGMERKSVTATLKNVSGSANGATGLEHWVSNEIAGADLVT
ncbi:MAG TPA: hypothetical protein PKO06_03425, partial [Candidatus Ozemobacteraceae bacterium]|nr:hypothetical protein [Candidatus Ozemobacteraceae bacterium]